MSEKTLISFAYLLSNVNMDEMLQIIQLSNLTYQITGEIFCGVNKCGTHRNTYLEGIDECKSTPNVLFMLPSNA